MEAYIVGGQPLIMLVKERQAMVMGRIKELGEFSYSPKGMEIDEEKRIYHNQNELDYKVDVSKGWKWTSTSKGT